MDHLLLLLLLLLWSSGAQSEGNHMSTESNMFRLVGGDSRCAGRLHMKDKGDWRPEGDEDWNLKKAAAVCRELDCGSAVSLQWRGHNRDRSEWLRMCKELSSFSSNTGNSSQECERLHNSFSSVNLACSDSVRLLDGTGLCSGRLEVRSYQRWSSVCDADFDQQDAEVVCRELGCGAPLAHQGGLYGEGEAAVGSTEFQCGGHESALLDCKSSDSARTTCSPGKAVGLTCSEPDEFRLVGGDSRCAGRVELKHKGAWRSMDGYEMTLMEAAGVCRELDCGSAVSVEQREESSERPVWWINPNCVETFSVLMECVEPFKNSSSSLDLTCSDSVRLLDGTGLCSGRLEVRSYQRWSSVCDADCDQQDAEVVCRELGCGAPLAHQGGLYGEGKAPVGSTKFQCGGHESALLDCKSSDSARTTCSPGKAVGLTCSEPDEIRLVGGDSRCAGRVELKHQGDWKPVGGPHWILKKAAVVCRELDCGSAVSVEKGEESSERPVWWINSDCVEDGSSLRECVQSITYSSYLLNLACSDLLLKPIIFVSSVDGVSQARQQGLQVFSGFSFTISCSRYCCKQAIRGQMSNRQEDIDLVNSPLGVGAAEEEGDVQGVHLTCRGI